MYYTFSAQAINIETQFMFSHINFKSLITLIPNKYNFNLISILVRSESERNVEISAKKHEWSVTDSRSRKHARREWEFFRKSRTMTRSFFARSTRSSIRIPARAVRSTCKRDCGSSFCRNLRGSFPPPRPQNSPERSDFAPRRHTAARYASPATLIVAR